MKKLRLFLIMSFIICYVTVFTACTVHTLNSPTGLNVDDSTLILVWDEVKNARAYTVDINGKQENTGGNSYSLEGLAGGTLTIKVKALGDGKDYGDSDWSEPLTYLK